MSYLFDSKNETTSPNSLGELKKSPLRRRTHTPVRSVRRGRELQERFDFGRIRNEKPAEGLQWPAIVAGNPLYPSALMQQLAAMSLHRSRKPHRSEFCLFCEREAEKQARFAA